MGTWLVIVTPSRVDHPVDRRYAQLSRWHDRSETYFWSAGIVCAAVLFVALISVVGPEAALVVAVMGPVAVVLWGRRAYQRRLGDARHAVVILQRQTGPLELARGKLIDPEVREQADRAVAAQGRIFASAALQQGSLGAPAVIGRHLSEATWQVVWMACQLDERLLNTNWPGTPKDWQTLRESTVVEAEQADRALSEQERTLQDAASELVKLAEQVAELDAQLLTPAAREHLRSIADAPQIQARDDCIDAISGQITAAHQVLDVGGFTLPTRM
ncbi:hypothetical protein HCA61_25690 [Rhodococcus sp. HNM0563]|uniref:hypothetical protein n=1 Tax=Rhodococcus sp. HNM0563 TaxID=2716339 RepID=UPI00146A60D5|nr:hypothetical protein [Rhodococcus sp. HNM0563]NLU65626.1 hypothetical protein [Rhodococcus sp. HNM0563]